MTRSPRMAAVAVALMLMITSVAPSWAWLGPLKEWTPSSIGDPGLPDGSGRAHYMPLGLYAATPAAGNVFILDGSTVAALGLQILAALHFNHGVNAGHE